VACVSINLRLRAEDGVAETTSVATAACVADDFDVSMGGGSAAFAPDRLLLLVALLPVAGIGEAAAELGVAATAGRPVELPAPGTVVRFGVDAAVPAEPTKPCPTGVDPVPNPPGADAGGAAEEVAGVLACKSLTEAVGVAAVGVAACLPSACSGTGPLVGVPACGGGRMTPFAAAA